MIEEMVINYLDKELKLPCYAEEPEDQSGFFAVIEKTGGGMKNYIGSSTIAVKSYADSLVEAAELNEKVKIAMIHMAMKDGISKVSLNSDYNFTDPTKKNYRYQAVFDITLC